MSVNLSDISVANDKALESLPLQVNDVVTTSLTATADAPTPSAEDLNNLAFNEIVRRIPEHKREIIETRLKEVNSTHLALLHAAIDNQENLLTESSFIHDELFPFAALLAVRMGQISPLQLGTLMALWGNLENILPKPKEQEAQLTPEFVPLFTVDGEKDPLASQLLLKCLKQPSALPNLFINTPEELVKGIYDKAIDLPKSEQGFWIVENSAHKPGMPQTITQRIKSLGFCFLASGADDEDEMIPSFGLKQLFLEVAFPHAVRLNPVIGDSTPIDIREGSLNRTRDIGLPFPGNELPKVADNFPAPSALDFMIHDTFHAIRASRVTAKETQYYIAIGDSLNILQNRYDLVVKKLDKRHNEHKRVLPEFGKAIRNLPENKQREVTEQVLKKFNQEKSIINKLKKMRKSNGQLKFRLWDMERPFSGSAIDVSNENALQELTRIIANIDIDIHLLERMPNTVGISKYSGRRVAHAFLEAVKPQTATLTALANESRESLSKLPKNQLSFFKSSLPPGQQGFEDVIIPSLYD